eukprot:4080210-Heterocapsa_arctica.AAC.1
MDTDPVPRAEPLGLVVDPANSLSAALGPFQIGIRGIPGGEVRLTVFGGNTIGQVRQMLDHRCGPMPPDSSLLYQSRCLGHSTTLAAAGLRRDSVLTYNCGGLSGGA